MKDFDEIKTTDREFTVGGETFHWRDVRPEVLSSFETDEPEGADEKSVWQIVDDRILKFIDPAERDKWTALRAREENPVTIRQLNEISRWLFEEQTGRPTETPAPSATGRGKTVTTSKAA